MVSLPEGSYKMHESLNIKQRKDVETDNLLQLLNESTLEVATLEQDTRVAQFLRGRHNLIELDVSTTK